MAIKLLVRGEMNIAGKQIRQCQTPGPFQRRQSTTAHVLHQFMKKLRLENHLTRFRISLWSKTNNQTNKQVPGPTKFQERTGDCSKMIGSLRVQVFLFGNSVGEEPSKPQKEERKGTNCWGTFRCLSGGGKPQSTSRERHTSCALLTLSWTSARLEVPKDSPAQFASLRVFESLTCEIYPLVAVDPLQKV